MGLCEWGETGEFAYLFSGVKYWSLQSRIGWGYDGWLVKLIFGCNRECIASWYRRYRDYRFNHQMNEWARVYIAIIVFGMRHLTLVWLICSVDSAGHLIWWHLIKMFYRLLVAVQFNTYCAKVIPHRSENHWNGIFTLEIELKWRRKTSWPTETLMLWRVCDIFVNVILSILVMSKVMTTNH